MFSGECTCEKCGRVYRYDYRKGHTKKQCNSCRTNQLRFVHRRKERLVALLGGACEIWASLLAEARKCVLLCHNCHHEVENGVTSIPLAIEKRVRGRLRGIERIEPRRPGRPALS
ncbi:MAG: hypothetical protein ACRDL2_16545 [Gaiellaceae bacterium]